MNLYKDAFESLKGTMNILHKKLFTKPSLEERARWRMIEELVKKELPQKPIETKTKFECPRCHNQLSNKTKIKKYSRCHFCGQNLDWRQYNE